MSVDCGLKHHIDKEFASKLFDWGKGAYQEFLEALIEDLMPVI